MTWTLSHSRSLRPRWRSIVASFALIGALVASSAAMSASAEDIGTGPGVISGTATSGDGQPVAGAFVGASVSFGEGTAFWAYTSTDESGQYAFTDLALGYTYEISSSLSGHQQVPSQNVVLSEGSPTGTANFVFLPFESGVGTLSGHVTGDGTPLANTYVSAFAASGQSLSTVTDENGFYEFTGLANGEWNVFVSAGSEYQSLFQPSVQITDSAPAATTDFPFVSWPVGTSAIAGVVTDSATGEPLVGINVSSFGVDVAHNSQTLTDAEGAFSFDLLPEGTYSLNIFAPGYLNVSAEVSVLADQTVTFNRALVATNATISGHIKTKTGAPVVGIFVDAHTADGNFGGAETDENGNYVISNVGAAAYTLSIGGEGTPYKAKTRVVTTVANGNVTANFTLKNRKTGTIAGTVFGPGETQYTHAVCATLYSSRNKHVVREVVIDGEHYGDDAYYFANLKPGSYTVEFEDCDNDSNTRFDNVFLGGAKKYQDATFVTIAAAEDSYYNNVTLAFKTPTSTITGRVAKPNGTAIAGLTVHATDGTVDASAVTDAAGNYSIAGLYSGDYTVAVGGAGTQYVHKNKSVTAVEGATVVANFNLAKK